MTWWLVDTDTLASGRFVVSPLCETLACLHTLDRAKTAHPAEKAWFDEHHAAYRAMVQADPLTGSLLDAALGARSQAPTARPSCSCLRRRRAPRTWTLTGQTLGSVGRHPKVLFAADLVRRRRSGRSVLYCRTPTGDVLVESASRGGAQERVGD